MPHVAFTPNLRRHLSCPSLSVPGATVKEALAQVFQAHPRLEAYLLDDQGALRKHMVVFVDGAPARDRKRLSDPVEEQSEIFIMQALSGG
jgi:sulfur carrier protein ThiS